MDYQLRPDRDLTVLIPARAGSKRVPGKNTRELGGKPLIQWTIDAAKAANVASIVVSTDDPVAARMAHEDFETLIAVHQRKPEHATDDATDFSWIYDLRVMIQTRYFAILRPTSPFRTASTIRRAFAQLVGSGAHSVRAVERVYHPHPGKMWVLEEGSKLMKPLIHGSIDGTPWHSCPTQALPPVYKQTSSLEMAQTWVIEGTKTISGYTIAPLLVDGEEGFSIDTEDDWAAAEAMVLMNGYGHGI